MTIHEHGTVIITKEGVEITGFKYKGEIEEGLRLAAILTLGFAQDKLDQELAKLRNEYL